MRYIVILLIIASSAAIANEGGWIDRNGYKINSARTGRILKIHVSSTGDTIKTLDAKGIYSEWDAESGRLLFSKELIKHKDHKLKMSEDWRHYLNLRVEKQNQGTHSYYVYYRSRYFRVEDDEELFRDWPSPMVHCLGGYRERWNGPLGPDAAFWLRDGEKYMTYIISGYYTFTGPYFYSNVPFVLSSNDMYPRGNISPGSNSRLVIRDDNRVLITLFTYHEEIRKSEFVPDSLFYKSNDYNIEGIKDLFYANNSDRLFSRKDNTISEVILEDSSLIEIGDVKEQYELIGFSPDNKYLLGINSHKYYIDPNDKNTLTIGRHRIDIYNADDLSFVNRLKIDSPANSIVVDSDTASPYTAIGLDTTFAILTYDQAPGMELHFRADRTICHIQDEVNFFDLSIGMPDALVWDFGDGYTAGGEPVSHSFQSPGYYSVTLTAEQGGIRKSQTYADYIHVLPLLKADFNASATFGSEPLEVRFEDQSDGEIIKWRWEFGDSTSSDSRSPRHTYDRPGEYSVRLIVSDSISSDTSDYATITVEKYVDKQIIKEIVSNIDENSTECAGAYIAENDQYAQLIHAEDNGGNNLFRTFWRMDTDSAGMYETGFASDSVRLIRTGDGRYIAGGTKIFHKLIHDFSFAELSTEGEQWSRTIGAQGSDKYFDHEPGLGGEWIAAGTFDIPPDGMKKNVIYIFDNGNEETANLTFDGDYDMIALVTLCENYGAIIQGDGLSIMEFSAENAEEISSEVLLAPENNFRLLDAVSTPEGHLLLAGYQASGTITRAAIAHYDADRNLEEYIKSDRNGTVYNSIAPMKNGLYALTGRLKDNHIGYKIYDLYKNEIYPFYLNRRYGELYDINLTSRNTLLGAGWIYRPQSSQHDAYCAEMRLSQVIENILSVGRYEAPEISIYPNPADEYLTIECAAEPFCRIDIYSGLGEHVLSPDISGSGRINTAMLAPGIYFARIGGRAVPFVIER
ncbi:MAG: PKD domain-containing protein [Candidatus Kapaibacterium sp.]